MDITLKKITEKDKQYFKTKIQESFGIAISKIMDNPPIIPSNKELDNAFKNLQNDTYFICVNDEKVGGAIIKINNETNNNSLELFYINKEQIGKGFGLKAWQLIEKQYPDTKIWRTVTPYFERRNVNFYINKCGFKVVEYCNKYHKSLDEHYNQTPEGNIPEAEDFFVFEKIMNEV